MEEGKLVAVPREFSENGAHTSESRDRGVIWMTHIA